MEPYLGVPRCIRMDRGTENGYLEDMQNAFRWDHSDTMSGEKSVIIGSFHTNHVQFFYSIVLKK
ncbi:hypothetical protein KUTeg_018728 [Tegillarca granosa]|uniref:Uncharacterized protein n=1 Tax=Tegillarca granosa TaxID=220873 RepID=A0ABQ9EJV1_TEGGR|nr:hypothetical protein KUTeg_018728 [Tegillarca granosa]